MLCQRLMTMGQRVKARQLQDAFESARSDMFKTWAPDMVDFPEHLTEDERGIVLEAAAVSNMREERHQHKQRMRSHKGIHCAGGCGTRFGKRRSDHNFSGGGGIEGGWHCESNLSCRDKPSGNHFCGMCTLERRELLEHLERLLATRTHPLCRGKLKTDLKHGQPGSPEATCPFCHIYRQEEFEAVDEEEIARLMSMQNRDLVLDAFDNDSIRGALATALLAIRERR